MHKQDLRARPSGSFAAARLSRGLRCRARWHPTQVAAGLGRAAWLRASIVMLALNATIIVAADGITVRGPGASSCGTWTADRRRGGEWPMMDEAWILGFLTGSAYVATDGRDPVSGVDNEGIFAWIDNYCRANPLKEIIDAAAAFERVHPR